MDRLIPRGRALLLPAFRLDLAFGLLLMAIVLLAIAPHRALAAGVSGDLTAEFNGKYTATNDLGTPTLPLDVKALIRLTEGTTAGKADLMFVDQRTLSASANENLDLAGVLVDPFGATLTFAKVKAILIIADPGNTNDVVVGGAGSNPFVGPLGGTTPTVAIKPGGSFLVAAPGTGWTVTPSTGDQLKVANGGSGTGVTYKVIIIGTSV